MKDPVCGMAVTDKSFYHLEQQGQCYYFCSGACKLRFANRGLRPAPGSPVKPAVPMASLPRGLRWHRSWQLSLALVALLLAARWLLGQ